MRQNNHEINKYRIRSGRLASTDAQGNNGAFRVKTKWGRLFCIASDGTSNLAAALSEKEWEHVSVSLHSQDKTPTWEIMCYIKDLFWGDDETVVQFHPKQSEYVNTHPHVLHLWKPVGEEIALPPRFMV